MTGADIKRIRKALGLSGAERWQPVCGSKFLVSDQGQIIGPSGRVLRGKHTREGYVRITINVGRRQYKDFRLHRLVAEAFLGPPPFPSADICHFDGNGKNNALSNLRWGTRKENMEDARRHGHLKGRAPTTSTIDPDTFRSLREALGLGRGEFGKLLGVEYGMIWAIERGKRPVNKMMRRLIEMYSRHGIPEDHRP